MLKYANPVLQANLRQPESEEEALQRKAIDLILPPKTWRDADSNIWVQNVALTPATKEDVIAIRDQLSNLLTAKGARPVGMCPIREPIYVDCFEELIRQVTLDCIERGQLLNRVKQDLEERTKSLQNLYVSATAFGMRKALQTADKKKSLDRTTRDLRVEIERKKEAIRAKKSELEKLKADLEAGQESDKQKHKERVTDLNAKNDQLKSQIEALLAAPPR